MNTRVPIQPLRSFARQGLSFVRRASVSITAWTVLGLRLVYLMVYPLAVLLVVNVVIAVDQGSELLRIVRTEWPVARQLIYLHVPLLLFSAAIAVSALAAVTSAAKVPPPTGSFGALGGVDLKRLTALIAVPAFLLPQAIFAFVDRSTLLSLLFVTSALLVTSTYLWVRRVDSLGRTLHPRGWVWILGALITSVVVLCLMNVPALAPAIMEVGPLGIMLLGLGAWCALLTIVFVAAPVRLGLPNLAWLPVALALAWTVFQNPVAVSAPGSEPFTPQSLQCDGLRSELYLDQARLRELPQCRLRSLEERFESWLGSREIRPDEDLFPVFLVAAEGGGVRAAYWAAASLSRLNQVTDGRFSKHLFALSGISGGSAGIAAYTDVMLKGVNPDGADRALRDMFRSDFLSALVLGLIGPDALRQLLGPLAPSRTRGHLFEEALARRWLQTSGSESFRESFIGRFGDSTAKAGPALFLNSTNVESGNRFIFANVHIEAEDTPAAYAAFDPRAPYDLSHFSVAQVAHTSARFPYVSPALVVQGEPSIAASLLYQSKYREHAPSEVIWGRLVDGGYFENSGTTTLLDILRALMRIQEEAQIQATSVAPSPHRADQDKFRKMKERAALLAKVRFYALVLRNDPLTHDEHVAIQGVSRYPAEPSRLEIRTSQEIVELRRGGAETESGPIAVPFRQRIFGEGLRSPIHAMLTTRDARGAAARTALRQALQAGRFDPQGLCVARWPTDWKHPLSERQVACYKFAVGYLELDVADLINREITDVIGASQSTCVSVDNGPRPALGWTLAKDSADFMDCLLHGSEASREYERISAILGLQSSELTGYHQYLVDGWRRPPKEFR